MFIYKLIINNKLTHFDSFSLLEHLLIEILPQYNNANDKLCVIIPNYFFIIHQNKNKNQTPSKIIIKHMNISSFVTLPS